MEIQRTTASTKPTFILTIYGQGGTGKSTLASTAPKPVFIDAEDGTKAFAIRGIDVPVAHVKTWEDVRNSWKIISESDEYETVIIDPIGAFLDLLIDDVRHGGEMNQLLWGRAKDGMRRFIQAVKNSGKHVVFVAHEEEKDDDGVVLRRPMLAAKLSQPLIDLSDVVGNLRVDKDGKRVLLVQPESKFKAKDRYGVFGTTILNPNITEMIAKVHAAYDKPPFQE